MCTQAFSRLKIVRQDDYGNTPLHEALQNSAFEAAKLLVQFGADVKKPNQVGHTPEKIAVSPAAEQALKGKRAGVAMTGTQIRPKRMLEKPPCRQPLHPAAQVSSQVR